MFKECGEVLDFVIYFFYNIGILYGFFSYMLKYVYYLVLDEFRIFVNINVLIL